MHIAAVKQKLMNFENFIQVERKVQKQDHRIALVCMKLRMKLVFFVFRQSGKIFSYPSVINAEKLVCPGSHVNIIRFALCPFFVHKGIHRIINRRAFDKAVQLHGE